MKQSSSSSSRMPPQAVDSGVPCSHALSVARVVSCFDGANAAKSRTRPSDCCVLIVALVRARHKWKLIHVGCLSAVTTLCVQGPRMVRDVFRLAKENAPSIIFIDEVDAIATARFDAQTGQCGQVQWSICV